MIAKAPPFSSVPFPLFYDSSPQPLFHLYCIYLLKLTSFCSLFSSLPPPLPLTYSGPPGMIKCQNTRKKETRMPRADGRNVLGLEVHQQLALRVNMLGG